MIHAGGRPHVCQLCNKTFIFKFDLNRHMKIHAERGYSCSKCGKAFLKQNTLMEHQTACTAQDSAKKEERDTPDTHQTEVKRETASKSPRHNSVPNLPRVGEQQQSQFFSPPHRLVCLMCMQEFPSQAAYSVHFSIVHFREAAMHLQQQKVAVAASLQGAGSTGIFGNSPIFYQTAGGEGAGGWLSSYTQNNQNSSEGNNTMVSPGSAEGEEALNSGQLSTGTNGDSDISNAATTISEDNKGVSGDQSNNTTTSASMQQEIINKISCANDNHQGLQGDDNTSFPTLHNLDSDGAREEEEEEEASRQLIIDESGSHKSGEGCPECLNLGLRLRAALIRMKSVERSLVVKDAEINRLKEKMRRVGAVAGGLLESCSEFDKLWMLHSKKVYSQIQSVLNSLE